MNDAWLSDLTVSLPRHARIIADLGRAVEADDRWRTLIVGCSLGAGRGDEQSDIDAGLGYAASMSPADVERIGLELVSHAGTVVDVLAHRFDGWPDEHIRFAVEYDTGVQLDLAAVPAPWRTTRLRDIAIVDKDGDLDVLAKPDIERDVGTLIRQAREWVMLGWWAVSDIAKYLTRDSLFEAAARIDTVRGHSMQLLAAAQSLPDPRHGLTTLLDHPPFALPAALGATYPRPSDRGSVVHAARSAVDLLADASRQAGDRLGVDLSTPWSRTATARLDLARIGPRGSATL